MRRQPQGAPGRMVCLRMAFNRKRLEELIMPEDGNVFSLKSGKQVASQDALTPDVDEDVVRMLDNLLQQAKSGKLRSLAICGQNNDGTWTTGYAVKFRDQGMAMLGAIERLKLGWFRRIGDHNG